VATKVYRENQDSARPPKPVLEVIGWLPLSDHLLSSSTGKKTHPMYDWHWSADFERKVNDRIIGESSFGGETFEVKRGFKYVSSEPLSDPYGKTEARIVMKPDGQGIQSVSLSSRRGPMMSLMLSKEYAACSGPFVKTVTRKVPDQAK
jgi:hypothetical protein